MDARHRLLAALGDPQRLRIVDALALGDKAPSELGRDLGLSSNLLAHHIGVLTEAGAVLRRRSEGDARRSYLALAWDEPIVAATVLASPAARIGRAGEGGDDSRACRVVFVCTANSARSQFAAALFREACALPVASAGTDPAAAVNPRAIAQLHRRGLTPQTPTPAHLDDTARDGDLVIAVCDNAYEHLGERAQVHWSIPDPARDDTDEAFAEAFDQIQPRVERLAAALGAPPA